MVQLCQPKIGILPSYLEFIEEMRSIGEKIWEDHLPRFGESSNEFIMRLINAEFKPEAGKVAETTYWAVLEDQVVGRNPKQWRSF